MAGHLTRTAHTTMAALRAASGTVARVARDAARRLRIEQVGQDIIEYAGMLAIIAAIIFLIWQFNLPKVVSDALNNKANSIVNGQGTQAPAQGNNNGTSTK